MKKLMILTVALWATTIAAHADNLLPVVELQVSKNHMPVFSSQGVQVKRCNQCPLQAIRSTSDTTYWSQNQKITYPQAVELFVRKEYDSVSIFYNRTSSTMRQIVFGKFNEELTETPVTQDQPQGDLK